MRLSFPSKAVGLSSSWHCSNDPTNHDMALTLRRSVALNLNETPAVWHPMSDGPTETAPPLFTKAKNGSTVGLSSGAGSALVSIGDECSVKIKRCGVQVPGESNFAPFRPSIDWKVLDRGISYSSDVEPLGSMWAVDAHREVMCQSRLRAVGLSSAYQPLGVWSHPQDYGVAMFRIESDFRADELFMAIVSNIVADLLSTDCVRFDHTTGRLELHEVTPLAVFEDDSAGVAELESLGRALGGVYRVLYGLDFLRGVGNCWIGNEVIGVDGKISIVDLDEMVLPEEVGRASWRLSQQRWEWRAFISTLYTYFEQSSGHFLALPAAIVAAAAEDGFRTCAPPVLGSALLQSILERYESSGSLVWAVV
jgi:hypothetical protein